VQTLLDLSKGIAALRSGWDCGLGRSPEDRPEREFDSQPIRLPSHYESWDNRLVATGRHSEEIDHRDLVLHRLSKPTVIG
jgi:hypothetical protein